MFAGPLFSQYRTPLLDKVPAPAKVIAISVAANVLDAVGDGLYDEGNKPLGKSLQAASFGVLAMSPVILHVDVQDWWKLPISYVTCRFAIFDPIYNATRGLPLNYNGTTGYMDMLKRRLDPGDGLIVARGVSMAIFIHFSLKIR